MMEVYLFVDPIERNQYNVPSSNHCWRCSNSNCKQILGRKDMLDSLAMWAFPFILLTDKALIYYLDFAYEPFESEASSIIMETP